MLRVPGSRKRSLIKARARGADVRMAYSAPKLSTSPPRILIARSSFLRSDSRPPRLQRRCMVLEAQRRGLDNFSVYCNHVLTPSAIQSILDSPEVRELDRVRIDGFIGPSHVSTIIGSRPYEYFAEEYQRPVVIAGFEPLDVMQAILMLVRQLNEGRAEVENQFTRGVTREGNKGTGTGCRRIRAASVVRMARARQVAYSGLRIKSKYADFDAERRFA